MRIAYTQNRRQSFSLKLTDAFRLASKPQRMVREAARMEVFAVRMGILDENGGRLIRILEKKKIPNAFHPMADFFLCPHCVFRFSSTLPFPFVFAY